MSCPLFLISDIGFWKMPSEVAIPVNTKCLNSRQKGRECEQKVSDFLASCGYVILEKNYSCKMGEVDIISLKDDVLCFVEVKSLPEGWPLEELSRMVDFQKQKRIKLTATQYLNTVDLSGRFRSVRFDVAAVLGSKVSYIEGAF